MKCQQCHKEFKPKEHAHYIKYCSQNCRNKVYYQKRGGAVAQREYYYKRYLSSKSSPKIKCEMCGKYFRQVGSHIYNFHKVKARDYRFEYGFDVKRGQLPDDLREHKAEQVFDNGTVKNLKKGKKYWFKKGQKGLGIYTRSEQTLQRLKHQFKR